jgi:Ca2+-binding EF-hand superfamily protein
MAETAFRPIVVRPVLRRITAQCEDIADARRRITFQDFPDVLFGMADAGEMGNGRDRGGLLDPDDEIVGELPRPAASTVGHRNESRLERLQFADRLIEILPRCRAARWEKFEGERWFRIGENVVDMHGERVIGKTRLSGWKTETFPKGRSFFGRWPRGTQPEKRYSIMKTIPVSFLIAGMLLPVVCRAQSEELPKAPPADEKGEHREPPRPFMEAWKLADTDHDGFITKEEFDAIPRIQNLPEEKKANIFKRLDKDGDGKLSRDELSHFGKPHDGPPMQRLWELDTDKSGGISFEEFKAGQLFMKLSPEKQSEVFHRLDTDGDGLITPKDKPEPPFKRPDGKKGPRRPDGDEPGQINRKLDLDGDGALTFEEFRKGPAVKNLTEDQQEERFQMLDRNGDLKISIEDFPPPPPPAPAPAPEPAPLPPPADGK